MKRWIPVLAAAACALSGCVRVEEEAKEQKFMAGSLPLPEYAPIERYKLELNLEGRRDLVAGSPGVLHFSLTNADTQPVRIPEWYADEPKNIQLFCQPWFEGEKEPNEDLWIPIEYDWQQDLTGHQPQSADRPGAESGGRYGTEILHQGAAEPEVGECRESRLCRDGPLARRGRGAAEVAEETVAGAGRR